MCSLRLNRNRSTMKAVADPTREPPAAKKKPFMPYAKPHKVTTVVCPIHGGNEMSTVDIDEEDDFRL